MIVILTALDLEYQAVRRHLTDLDVRRHPAGTRFEVGRLAAEGKKWISHERRRERAPLANLTEAVDAIFV